ncbi:hypothetical protein BDD12DRAFT_508459 [Trichophaea hybrida]|nr:hypothetical protein BDD12DRAFT_508459 [Trichophaea hybrida]
MKTGRRGRGREGDYTKRKPNEQNSRCTCFTNCHAPMLSFKFTILHSYHLPCKSTDTKQPAIVDSFFARRDVDCREEAQSAHNYSHAALAGSPPQVCTYYRIAMSTSDVSRIRCDHVHNFQRRMAFTNTDRPLMNPAWIDVAAVQMEKELRHSSSVPHRTTSLDPTDTLNLESFIQ